MTARPQRPLSPYRRAGLAALLLAVGLISWTIGDRLARSWYLEAQLGPIETLREHEGQYVVNDFLTRGYEAKASTVVAFGDSANDSMPPEDTDRRFITEMLDDALKDDRIDVFGVSFPGNSPAWMSSHLRFLIQRFPDLDYVVIPLNLRWISPGWRQARDTNEARASYERYGAGPFRWVLGVDLPFRSPRDYDPTADRIETVVGRFDAELGTMRNDQYKERFGGTNQEATERVRWHRIVLSYGFRMAGDDPLLTLATRISEDCEEHGLRCLFYLPPFNLEYIEQEAPAVARSLRENIATVRDHAQSDGLQLLDLSTNLARKHFHDIVNEHVNEVGRQLISGCLAAALRAWRRSGGLDGPVQTCSGSADAGFVLGRLTD